MNTFQRKHIRTVAVRMEGGISAAMASSLLMRESKRAKEEGWEEVLFEMRTDGAILQLKVTGIKR